MIRTRDGSARLPTSRRSKKANADLNRARNRGNRCRSPDEGKRKRAEAEKEAARKYGGRAQGHPLRRRKSRGDRARRITVAHAAGGPTPELCGPRGGLRRRLGAACAWPGRPRGLRRASRPAADAGPAGTPRPSGPAPPPPGPRPPAMPDRSARSRDSVVLTRELQGRPRGARLAAHRCGGRDTTLHRPPKLARNVIGNTRCTTNIWNATGVLTPQHECPRPYPRWNHRCASGWNSAPPCPPTSALQEKNSIRQVLSPASRG